jgi:drug/metabolite transporter (DMT)-like permease
MAGIPQPGPGYYGPAPAPGTIQERNSGAVALLCLFTCGIYFVYWIYQTSTELKQATGDSSINPTLDLVLTLVTCFLWGYYVVYRNAQKAHETLVRLDPSHQDQTQTVLILLLAAFVVGVTFAAAAYLVQEDLNRLARGGR